MSFLLEHPRELFILAFVALYLAAQLGVLIRRIRPERLITDDKDFDLVVGSTLTLLGLIIGFTFSMALSRYDQRKNYEEAEANAIGTEYVRVDFVPSSDAPKVRMLLRDYVDQRILYYRTRDEQQLRQIRFATAQLQANLWSSVATPNGPRDPVAALVLSGMNDVINSEGYTEAAWRNRVPSAAWILLFAIALFCNLLLGLREARQARVVLLILPLALAISFFLIADIDSPRSGIIRVHPRNLESLADSLHPQS